MSLAAVKTEKQVKTTLKELKSMIKELENLRENLDYHILDPEESLGFVGSIEFEKPVPVNTLFQQSTYSRELSVIMNTNKMWLKKLEFFNDKSYKVLATFNFKGVDGDVYEGNFTIQTLVEGLALLYQDNVYREFTGGRVKVEGSELNDFLNFVDNAVKDVVQSGAHTLLTPRELFRKHHEATGKGDYMIFHAKDWRLITFVTDFVGPHDEDYVGIVVKKDGIYITFYDLYLHPVDVVGIDSIKESRYKITSSTLAKSPLAPTLVKLVKDSVKYLNEYAELAKVVFLGVKAYVT